MSLLGRHYDALDHAELERLVDKVGIGRVLLALMEICSDRAQTRPEMTPEWVQIWGKTGAELARIAAEVEEATKRE